MIGEQVYSATALVVDLPLPSERLVNVAIEGTTTESLTLVVSFQSATEAELKFRPTLREAEGERYKRQTLRLNLTAEPIKFTAVHEQLPRPGWIAAHYPEMEVHDEQFGLTILRRTQKARK